MILSNVELHRALDNGRLIISPEPRPRVYDPADSNMYCPYETHAVDLTLDSDVTVLLPGTFAFDLMQPFSPSPFLARNSRRLHAASRFRIKVRRRAGGESSADTSRPRPY
jgi:hypothetical protein